ncbi:hypothetical protein HanXRQr2_Chr13g0584591 [Helianthus annuus]|uniref:Uncharacterized protein n=1 Tax=Helianthus annuus TaxID=4232 RepID=A0A9K3EIX1_HELAN|nr:hypothetical protein HanXRQr2_Chr13g0584591 [Helianthus annuus]KAJ0476617.1 hypothetical protein HanHA300_Chr13g0479321 [Helianthus annuus]KAJ0480872.1 hypothetical protein HanIR_Chr13g0636511 [Helianthus annuus]KAJ0497433.1 hypothetical protein HanHA89_Chr13g0511331 [Helianthus annuus]KAJ0848904.1 hypothetical protein HanPSC8_Chr13g0562841 [Helianthus annuus]
MIVHHVVVLFVLLLYYVLFGCHLGFCVCLFGLLFEWALGPAYTCAGDAFQVFDFSRFCYIFSLMSLSKLSSLSFFLEMVLSRNTPPPLSIYISCTIVCCDQLSIVCYTTDVVCFRSSTL